ncbi:hypothetical protein H8959_018113 [Pygathrix nigripes]
MGPAWWGCLWLQCQAAVRETKSQTSVILSIVHCPPVTTAIIHRPHTREQLGFCVEDGIICSLLRGGIAERGGIRVGHRIIEINGQSVVATPHARIIELLTEAYGEVHIKTMPACHIPPPYRPGAARVPVTTMSLACHCAFASVAPEPPPGPALAGQDPSGSWSCMIP